LLHHLKDEEIKSYIEHKLEERKIGYSDFDLKVEADLINEITFATLLKQYV
jgi:hypothetical protein